MLSLHNKALVGYNTLESKRKYTSETDLNLQGCLHLSMPATKSLQHIFIFLSVKFTDPEQEFHSLFS